MSLECRDYTEIIKKACEHITADQPEAAAAEIRQGYPFTPFEKSKRSYSPLTMTKIFLRDGFLDRYRGTKLVFPPTLRVLSLYLPHVFPYHKNGKMSEGHFAYWELFPTIDHVDPVARSGPDSVENWVCCSMLTNSIKSNWTLEQLGWKLLPPGDLKVWDGLFGWFIQQVEKDSALLENQYLKIWYSAARAAQ